MVESINLFNVTVYIKIFLYISKSFVSQTILTTGENIKNMIGKSHFSMCIYRYFLSKTKKLYNKRTNK